MLCGDKGKGITTDKKDDNILTRTHARLSPSLSQGLNFSPQQTQVNTKSPPATLPPGLSLGPTFRTAPFLDSHVLLTAPQYSPSFPLACPQCPLSLNLTNKLLTPNASAVSSPCRSTSRQLIRSSLSLNRYVLGAPRTSSHSDSSFRSRLVCEIRFRSYPTNTQNTTQCTANTDAPTGTPNARATLFRGSARRNAATLDRYRGVPGAESKIKARTAKRCDVASRYARARQAAL